MPAPLTHSAHTLARRALTWLHRHRELGAFPADVTADLDDPNSFYKPLGEVALAAALVLREGVAAAAEARAARELLAFAWTEMRAGDLLYERQLRHGLLTDPLETYTYFVRGGYRHAGLDELVAHNAAVGSTAEVLPNRRLAVANAYRTLGLDGTEEWSRLIRATWLGGRPQPWAIDWMTGYSLTHTAFHVTDWGARPADLPAALADFLGMWLPVWIDVWSEVEQWDLVGELLIVGLCLPEPRCEAHEWEPLIRVQHADGLLPRDGQPVDDDPVQRFLDHQHTAVVGTIAGTLALSRLLSQVA